MKLELNAKERAVVQDALKVWFNPIVYLYAKPGKHDLSAPELTEREARSLLRRVTKNRKADALAHTS